MFNKKIQKMKTKHILMSLALSATFAACSNEELFNSESLNTANDELIELPEGFLLAGTRGDDTATRGAWEYGSATEYALKHAWMPTEVFDDPNYKYLPDEIGLSWTGVNGNVGISAATDMVHSNYKFTHYAWGINGKVAEYDNCNKTYDNIITLESLSGVDKMRDVQDGSVYYQHQTPTTQLSWKPYSTTDGDADITRGFFNTENSTVYAGQYIVYAPFDKDNVSNYVTATSSAYFTKSNTNITKELAFEDLNNEIFMYGTTTLDKGGIQAGSFSASNLSGFILLKVSGTMANLKKVMLYDEDGKFLTKVGLSAKGIVNGLKGTSLYLDNAAVEKEYSKFITVEFNNAFTLNADGAYIAIPVLPTETAIENLTVICIDKDGNAIDKTISGAMTIPANGYASVNGGAAQWFEIKDVNSGTYKVATDYASLQALVSTANGETEATNINILGDIVLEAPGLTLNNTNNKTITLGVVKAGKLVVPAAASQVTLYLDNGSVLDVDVDVEANCCTTYPGMLKLREATVTENSTINVFADEDDETLTNDGQLLFFYNGGKNVISTLNGVINNAGNLVIGNATAPYKTTVIMNAGAEINNSGTMTLLRSSKSKAGTNEYDANLSLNNGAKVNNSGTIYVEGEYSNYGETTNTGAFYDRVAAQVTGNNNIPGGGEYICDVNDNGQRFYSALNERPAVTQIRFVEKDEEYSLLQINEAKGRNNLKNLKKIVVDAAGKDVTFVSTVGAAAPVESSYSTVEVKIPALDVVAGDLIISEKASDSKSLLLNVEGAVNIMKDGTLSLSDAVKRTVTMFQAVSVNVEKKGQMTVDNKAKASISGNVTINGDQKANELGILNVNNNAIFDVYGDFINWGKTTITTATSGTDIAGLIWVNTLSNVKGGAPSDKAYYPAGTPTVRP